MGSLGITHLVFAVLSLAFGLATVLLRKGTRLHRTIGHLYFGSMLGLNVTALSIYRLFGGFGPFHIAALLSLGSLLAGMVPVILRRPRKKWLELHAHFMSWSYVGLLAAAVAETTSRTLNWNFWIAVVIPAALVGAIAQLIVPSRVDRSVHRFLQRRTHPAAGTESQSSESLNQVDPLWTN